MSSPLTTADVLFINRVAARRFTGAEPPAADAGVIESALQSSTDEIAVRRASQLAAALLGGHAFSVVPLHTCLLALHCALAADGLVLLAPQGVVVGMIRSLDRDGDTADFARWLEDRTVPAASGA